MPQHVRCNTNQFSISANRFESCTDRLERGNSIPLYKNIVACASGHLCSERLKKLATDRQRLCLPILGVSSLNGQSAVEKVNVLFLECEALRLNSQFRIDADKDDSAQRL